MNTEMLEAICVRLLVIDPAWYAANGPQGWEQFSPEDLRRRHQARRAKQLPPDAEAKRVAAVKAVRKHREEKRKDPEWRLMNRLKQYLRDGRLGGLAKADAEALAGGIPNYAKYHRLQAKVATALGDHERATKCLKAHEDF
jgi:hypothetical protein